MAPRTLRAGVAAEDVEFGELGYAREARTSYRWFAAAKADGRIAPKVKFQVSLPTPFGILRAAVASEAIPLVEPAYEAAMGREIDTIAAAIPHDQLAFQWDVCLEMLAYDGRAFRTPWDDGAFRGRFARLTAAVPADVDLGVHLCYGDYDGVHVVEPLDAAKMTELANLVADVSARPLQFLHVPVPVGWDDDRYYAPFAGLRLAPETEVFLGLVHLADGVAGARRRVDLAAPYVHAFGVATECGIGRAHTTPEVEAIFDIHAALTSPVASHDPTDPG
jgi:hypothetical protein